MIRRRGPRPALTAVAAAVALGLALVGCTSLPESGPVVDANQSVGSVPERAFDLDATPPRAGASQVEVVRGFLDAMTASPIQFEVAREYLSARSGAAWNPEASTVIYAEKMPERVDGSTVTVRLGDAERLDGSGAWRGRLDDREETLRFSMVLEDGEYRIDDPPDALVVPTTWFTQRFSAASLYFFDPTARILVPQPVFVPRGEQLASALGGALAAGPDGRLSEVLRTFLPRGLRIGVSVPVSDGVASVELLGEAAPLSDGQTERMLAQLAWTLRQVPGVTAIRATVGGEPVRTPGGEEQYAVSQADAFDPTGSGASIRLYGLREGRLVLNTGGDFVSAGGPFAENDLGVRSVALDIAADRVAGVSEDGTRVLVAGVGEEVGARGEVEVVVDDGEDLLRPAWDYLERTWLVDRAPAGGARVRYVDDSRVRTVLVPGISGRDVTSFLVSRDGTRLVATVAGAGGDTIRISRIRSDAEGIVLGASRSTLLDRSATASEDVLELGWTSPTSVAFLSEAVPEELYEVRTLPVDGAPASASSLSSSVSAAVTGLVTSPDPTRLRYVSTPSGLVDLESGRTLSFVEVDPEVSWVGYVG